MLVLDFRALKVIKKFGMSTFNAGPANTGAAPYVEIIYIFQISVELTAGKIREMMANAQRAIAQRKFELGLVGFVIFGGVNLCLDGEWCC